MKNKLYLECTSGISGDMAVAALLDLGASREKLKRVLKGLPVKGFDIKISRVVKSGIDACDFDVVLDKEHENHDHDMGYLHGHEHDRSDGPAWCAGGRRGGGVRQAAAGGRAGGRRRHHPLRADLRRQPPRAAHLLQKRTGDGEGAAAAVLNTGHSRCIG